MAESKSYEDLIAPESLSFVRSGSGFDVSELQSWFASNPGFVRFYSPARYWSFDAAGTFNDAAVTDVGEFEGEGLGQYVRYVVAWSPATFTVPTETFFRTYLTQSSAYQIFTESPPATGSGVPTGTVGDAVGDNSLTWRNDTYQGTPGDAV